MDSLGEILRADRILYLFASYTVDDWSFFVSQLQSCKRFLQKNAIREEEKVILKTLTKGAGKKGLLMEKTILQKGYEELTSINFADVFKYKEWFASRISGKRMIDMV